MHLRLKQSWSQGFVKANPAVANPGSVAGLEVLHITSSYWCRTSNIYNCPAGCGLKPQSGTSCVSSSGQGHFNLSLLIRCRNSSITLAYFAILFHNQIQHLNHLTPWTLVVEIFSWHVASGCDFQETFVRATGLKSAGQAGPGSGQVCFPEQTLNWLILLIL